jgi:hypothetical protein
MPKTDGTQQMDGRQLCASILMTVGELRSWTKRILEEKEAPSFAELCGMSEQLLSAATELTSTALQITQAAQVLNAHAKNKRSSLESRPDEAC